MGTPLAKALGLNDIVFEIDNKSLSNRPDLWGHYGLAREVAVLFGKKIKEYKTKEIKPGKDAEVEGFLRSALSKLDYEPATSACTTAVSVV